jgi:hypothetical protein
VNQFVTLEGEQVVDQTPAVWEWELQDIMPPDTTISGVRFLGPLDLIEPNSWEFTFTGEDNRTPFFELEFECSFDGLLFEGCDALHYILLEELSAGDHELHVRAVDEMGNADPTPDIYFWSTEGEPDTTILTGPAAEVDSTEATFTFSSDQADATFECALDGATVFTPCASPLTLTGVPYGEHELLVRAVSASGTELDLTPAEYSWVSCYHRNLYLYV